MNAFEKIRTIAEAEGMHAFLDRYVTEHHPELGTLDRWVTYNTADDRGALFGGDGAQENVLSLQIHVYLPEHEDYLDLKKRIRKSLSDADFTWPVITVETEEEHRVRHIIFECDIEEEE